MIASLLSLWRGLMVLGALAGLVACAAPRGGAADSVAAADITTASDESPQHRRARIRTELAVAYLQRGQAQVALDEAKQALTALATYAPAHLVKALAYMALERPELARVALDQALALSPNDLDVILNDAWWYCAQARYDSALVRFDAALQRGGAARAWLGKAVCGARSGTDATAAFEQAYALAPRDAQVVETWAQYALDRRQWNRVHELLTPHNASPQVSAQSLWLQAQAHRQQGQRSAMQALAQRLIAAFPDSPQAAQVKRESWHE